MAQEMEFRPRCPTCDMLADPQVSGKYMPFCCERCRLIDLGRWLNEEHPLPCETDEEEPAEATQSTSGKAIQLPPGWHDA